MLSMGKSTKYLWSCSIAVSLPEGTGWGPQDSIQLVYKWLNAMVYGRYNELVTGDYNGL